MWIVWFRRRGRQTIWVKSYTIPLTCNRALYLISAAGFLATHVYSPECEADNEGMLNNDEYWSNIVTLAPNRSGNGSPSLSHVNFKGGSPRDTPHTVRVRIPSARPSWKTKGSIIGGTATRPRKETKNKIYNWISTWSKQKSQSEVKSLAKLQTLLVEGSLCWSQIMMMMMMGDEAAANYAVANDYVDWKLSLYKCCGT